jgi:A/G-specific adenine glycosylase
VKPPEPADRRLAAAVEAWFAGSARDLPWRSVPRDPYRSLVSEIMLQQTQVSRVMERFGAFIDRFPTIAHLAAAPEEEVLAAWSGLGYYRRARLLHAAARRIATDHAGRVPETAPALRQLPGLGRYTAGAVASIVFGRPEPIVDGNIARVLLRLEGRPLPHGSPEAMDLAWARAGELVAAAKDPAAFNEGLMELGAVICTPRSPCCDRCPLARRCAARASGNPAAIPLARRAPARRCLHLAACIVRNRKGWILMERRADGLWAGLWQAPTIQTTRPAGARQVQELVGFEAIRVGRFTHATTHRDVRFTVWQIQGGRAAAGQSFKAPRDLPRLALGSAQKRVLQIAGVWPAERTVLSPEG